MVVVGCVCGLEWRESRGSENQQRQPDRALRLSAWLPGTVFTELHAGGGTGADEQGGAGAPLHQ